MGSYAKRTSEMGATPQSGTTTPQGSTRQGEKLDKDRFRQGLGGVIEAYEEVGRRLGITFPA